MIEHELYCCELGIEEWMDHVTPSRTHNSVSVYRQYASSTGQHKLALLRCLSLQLFASTIAVDDAAPVASHAQGCVDAAKDDVLNSLTTKGSRPSRKWCDPKGKNLSLGAQRTHGLQILVERSAMLQRQNS